jgi:antitoxin (DNA-binding transcriptional repressor) of toxin-antitoxin stability system
MVKVNLEQAREQLDRLMQAALDGETVLIVGADAQIVQLVATPQALPERVFGSGAGDILYISEDFNAPLLDSQV